MSGSAAKRLRRKLRESTLPRVSVREYRAAKRAYSRRPHTVRRTWNPATFVYFLRLSQVIALQRRAPHLLPIKRALP